MPRNCQNHLKLIASSETLNEFIERFITALEGEPYMCFNFIAPCPFMHNTEDAQNWKK